MIAQPRGPEERNEIRDLQAGHSPSPHYASAFALRAAADKSLHAGYETASASPGFFANNSR
jgi:hypothetical protein